MGAVIVHNADDEPVVLRYALALVWEALDQPRTEHEICSALPVADVAEELRPQVHAAVVALQEVGLVTRFP